MPSLRSQRHRPLRSTLIIFTIASLIATLLVMATGVFAQTDAPDAPSDVAVYTYSSQTLEVRWSSPDAADTTSFKIQWKSGSQGFDSSRQLTSDPASSKVALQSTSTVERYKDTITDLTDGTEYTIRVIATNSNGDSDPSDEVTSTPQSSPGQVQSFIEKEVIELFESSHPWLRETWDYIEDENVTVEFTADEGGIVGISCRKEGNLYKCHVGTTYYDLQIGRHSSNLIYIITHELAHVYTLANGVADTPGPLGLAHLYFYNLLPARLESLPSYELFATGCTPSELYADALSLLTHEDLVQSDLYYWQLCELITITVQDEALAVVRSASSGALPSWFGDTYNDTEGDPDLEKVWADIKRIRDIKDRSGIVYQLRDSFGGYCDNRKATESAFGSGVTLNPWKDGGCVPEAPASVSAKSAGSGKLVVFWQDADYDGGSPIEGYKVQWKSGTQGYSSSRQATVNDLTDLRHVISGLTNDTSHTIRVMAYNHNGNGAAVETTATPTVTDVNAPVLLTARTDDYNSRVILTYDEELNEFSDPPPSAFTVSLNGISSNPSSVSIRDNIVTLSTMGIDSPSDAVAVSYTAPTGVGATPLRDPAGNDASDISDQAVRNDRTSVAFTSNPGANRIYSWNNGSDEKDVIEVTVTFSEPVEVRGVPDIGLLIGDRMRSAAYQNGSGTSSLVFGYGLTEGDADADGVSVVQGTIAGMVRYASTKAVAPAPVNFMHSSEHLVDAVRPVLISADMLADQNDLVLTWDKALDESSVPHPSDKGFYVWDKTAKEELRANTITVLDKQVTLTLPSSVSATDQIIVSFSEPSLKPLKDTVGNYAAEAIAFPVSIARHSNSPPEFPTSEDGARSVDENTPAGRNIGSPVAATDSDNDQRTYSISGTDAESFEVVATSGQLRTKEALDHESRDSYSFTMSVTDGKNIYGKADTTIDGTISVTVTINDVDEGPTVTGDAEPSVDENTETFSRTYSATDPEGVASTITWSLSGTDSGAFTIDSSTGELTFRNVPDHENPADSNRDNEHLVTVVATDQDNLRGMLEVTITVNDVNEAPTVTGNQALSFPEKSTRSVATYRANDPEHDSIAWSVYGTDSDDLDIDRSTGVLTFVNVPDLEHPTDADQDNEYLITVEARDIESNTDTLDVTVTVTTAPSGGGGGGGGAPSTPIFADGTNTSRSVTASTSAGDAVGDPVTASHPANLQITYSLSGVDSTQFTIDTSTGQIRVGQNASLVTEQTYAVTVTATDSTGGEAYIDVVITIVAGSHRYDLNGNGTFEKGEALKAINDYLFGDGLLTKEEVLEIINAYLFG